MRVMITGANGFVASHLIDYILENNPSAEIFGTIRRLGDRKNINHILEDITLIDTEITDSLSVRNAVDKIQPDRVFHTAGQSFVPSSWTSPFNTMEVNAGGTLNVLEAVRHYNPDVLTMISGSSEEYGLVHPHECPINEAQPLRPLSPYGVSKVAADKFGFQYAHSYDMNVLVTRAFNMTGPRRGDMFVDSNFAKQIVSMEYGQKKLDLYHGNLEAIRDFTDVRDTVRAFWMLSEKKWNGEAVNICSNVGRTIGETLYKLLELSPIGNRITLHEDINRMRPSDVPVLVGNNALLKSYISWEPEYEWKDSLKDLMAYWTRQLDTVI
jgi:GDP-4-dehydro-6-deoxy-D-mannose reductase